MTTQFQMVRAVFSILSTLATVSCTLHPCCNTSIKLPCETKFGYFCLPAVSGELSYRIYHTKSQLGPPILVLHELNGLSAPPLDFCLELECRGWTAYAPLLFGEYGDNRPFSAIKKIKDTGRWTLRDPHDSGPVLDDVAAMIERISKRHGGQRVVVMGNCLTGGFPLAVLGRRDVRAGILCQPALPMPLSVLSGLLSIHDRQSKNSYGVPDELLERTFDALQRDSTKKLIGFHYLEDWMARMEKFDWLHDELERRGMAEKFQPVILVPDKPGRREIWWRPELTQARRHLKGPHNTVTASDSAHDRRRMRTILLDWLEPLRHGD